MSMSTQSNFTINQNNLYFNAFMYQKPIEILESISKITEEKLLLKFHQVNEKLDILSAKITRLENHSQNTINIRNVVRSNFAQKAQTLELLPKVFSTLGKRSQSVSLLKPPAKKPKIQIVDPLKKLWETAYTYFKKKKFQEIIHLEYKFFPHSTDLTEYDIKLILIKIFAIIELGKYDPALKIIEAFSNNTCFTSENKEDLLLKKVYILNKTKQFQEALNILDKDGTKEIKQFFLLEDNLLYRACALNGLQKYQEALLVLSSPEIIKRRCKFYLEKAKAFFGLFKFIETLNAIEEARKIPHSKNLSAELTIYEIKTHLAMENFSAARSIAENFRGFTCQNIYIQEELTSILEKIS